PILRDAPVTSATRPASSLPCCISCLLPKERARACPPSSSSGNDDDAADQDSRTATTHITAPATKVIQEIQRSRRSPVRVAAGLFDMACAHGSREYHQS